MRSSCEGFGTGGAVHPLVLRVSFVTCGNLRERPWRQLVSRATPAVGAVPVKMWVPLAAPCPEWSAREDGRVSVGLPIGGVPAVSAGSLLLVFGLCRRHCCDGPHLAVCWAQSCVTDRVHCGWHRLRLLGQCLFLLFLCAAGLQSTVGILLSSLQTEPSSAHQSEVLGR